MSAAPLELGFAAPRGARREARPDLVRLVECTPFPRRRGDAGARRGFTRDISPSGLCACVDRAIAVGSLVRVRLRDVTGRVAREAIARVVWSEAFDPTGHRLGLELQAARAGGARSAAAREARLGVA